MNTKVLRKNVNRKKTISLQIKKIIALTIALIISTGISFAGSKKIAFISTHYGDIYIEFFQDKAPGHYKNFYKLAASGFYDGTTFHQIVPGLKIQGGDPNSKDDDRINDGEGGPGYTINAEINDLHHDRGMLAMARGDELDSAGSQFFIVVQNSRFLDGKFTIFGRVVHGMDVVDIIVSQPRDVKDNPLERIEMKIRIISRRKFEKIMSNMN